MVIAHHAFHTILEHTDADGTTDAESNVSYRQGTRSIEQSIHTEPHPDRERIKGADVGIIPFSRLQRCLVQVHNNGHPCEEEQQHHDAPVPQVFGELVNQTNEPEKHGQQEQFVHGLVHRHTTGQLVLITKSLGIDEFQTRVPVPVEYSTVTLYVVLSTSEIPHEIAPVHPIRLVVHEEAHVLPLRGLIDDRGFAFAISGTNANAFEVAPALVFLDVAGLAAVHAGEEHGEFGLVYRFGLFAIIGDHVFMRDLQTGLALHIVFGAPSIVELLIHFVALHHFVGGCVYGGSIFPSITHFTIPELACEQRPITILFAVQIAQQVEDVLGIVLIDRGVRIAADHDQCVGAVTHQDHTYTKDDRVQDHLPLTLAPKKAPHHQAQNKQAIHEISGIERHAHIIHEKQLELACHFHDTRNDDGLNSAENNR